MKKYLSLIKFSHTVFAMPFALIGFFLAINKDNILWIKLLLIILCMIFARSAAMAFNRFIDRDIDQKNNRTSKVREIPNGTIKPKSALIFVIINSIFFVLTCYYINTICLLLSPVALLIILGYSYTKRFTVLCHLILGIGLSLAPLGAYLAVKGEFSLTPILFSIAVLFWVSGFDIIYSLQDQDFDKNQNLFSIPVLIGKKKSLQLSIVFHLICVSVLFFIGLNSIFGFFYWVGLGVFSCLLFYQHTIVNEHDLSRVNLAFFTTNGIASIVFAAFVILELF
ncbi:MAG: 4-hydroxybenzoate octaprenyltransferase [Flavobacteriales bacterium]|nr:4-hydroxybenzoate octaprenyltransferase [Flavobacteriales bacterium]